MSLAALARPEAMRAWLAGRAAGLRLAGPAAWLMESAIRLEHDPGTPDARDVAVFSMPETIEDARAALLPAGRFRLHVIDRPIMKALARGFLPEILGNNFYVTEDARLLASRAALRGFLEAVWQRVCRRRRIDVLMSSNFTYWGERELHAACEAAGTAFVVLQKENLKTPGRLPFFRSLYRRRRGRFEGRRILCYNAIERELEIETGIVESERIEVTGMPRLDRLHRWREAASPRAQGRPTVLFFFFHEKTGYPFVNELDGFFEEAAGEFDAAQKDMAAPELARLTAEAVLRLAAGNPDLDVVVKGKREHGKGGLMDLFEGPGVPANLRVQAGGDPFTLLQRADAVLGHVSTALLEALAAGRPVVLPGFAERLLPAHAGFDLGLQPAADVARSPDDLVALLAARARERRAVPRQLSAEAVAALERWTGNPDGRAGERVALALDREIAGAASAGRRAA